MSRCELAKFTPNEADLSAILAIVGVIGEDRERLLKLARDIDQPAWWEVGLELTTQNTALIDAEQRARRITNATTMLVPGLLQTRGYTRALLPKLGVQAYQIERYVNVRQVRQGILTQSDPVELIAYFDEAAFARSVGGPSVMAEQLRHLASAAERANITPRVIPFSAGAHTVMSGGFSVIEFIRDSPVAHVEQRHSGAFLSEKEDVQPFLDAIEILDEVALNQDDSLEVIESYVAKHESQE
ncbi:DUF5753 domain-containing protein [Saccharopolyspora phatthalungensis]|uniref:DUF5753 domain-containing protein n=1 Tax=Saccharopolyspora phatthalungensis TaxID=664693 RepID=A0A840QCR1_9PSEU|nr:DUF5753 domain-containing protein [Saccharopolyspora phatthalungensis]MBB5157641.1 hypothetical protein [Saccharopolyspora phatthalungensis]